MIGAAASHACGAAAHSRNDKTHSNSSHSINKKANKTTLEHSKHKPDKNINNEVVVYIDVCVFMGYR